MSNSNLSPRNLIVLFLIFGAAIAGAELMLNDSTDASLLMTLTYWTMFAQGPIALGAITVASKGVWFEPMKRDMLSFYPLSYFMAFLFLLIGLRTDVYPWASHPPNGWLVANFFVIRNFAMMLVTAFCGHALARSVMRNDEGRHRLAVIYIFLWVAMISLVAFDWLMSLEYPFINTLFGGFYFIQSLLMGLFATAFVIMFRARGGETGLTETLRDTAKLMFAFSFMLGGFLFTQYLVIWYGNVPEEVDYLVRRVTPSPYYGLSRWLLGLMFLVPFLTLVFRKIKTVPWAVSLIGLASLAGMVVEQIIIITPTAPVNPIALVIEFAAMTVLAVLVFRSRNSFMLPYAGAPAGARSSHPDGLANAASD